MTRNHLLPFLVLLLAPLAAGPSEPQPTAAVLRGGICINEVHPSPASAPGTDANGDGSATNDDQYIELYNLGTETISLEGLELWTPLGRFYNFPAGAELPPGEFAFVVQDAPSGAAPPEAGIRFDADIDRMDGFLA
jgi:hypothetical protein